MEFKIQIALLLVCFVGLTVVSGGGHGHGRCGRGGGPKGLIKRIFHKAMEGDPPVTLPQCLDSIKAQVDNITEFMEFLWNTGKDCGKTCVTGSPVDGCMPSDDVFAKLDTRFQAMKESFNSKGEEMQKCLLGKVGSGCSNDPQNYQDCGKFLLHSMVPPEGHMCMAKCGFRKFVDVLQEEEKIDSDKVMAVFNAFQKVGPKLDKAVLHVMKDLGMKVAMMMKMHKPFKCLEYYCTPDAVVDCAKEVGLKEAIKERLVEIESLMEEGEKTLFPEACKCVQGKVGDQIKNPLIKNMDCDNAPNTRICHGLLMQHKFEHAGMMMGRGMGGMDSSEEDSSSEEGGSRKKREALDLWSNAFSAFSF